MEMLAYVTDLKRTFVNDFISKYLAFYLEIFYFEMLFFFWKMSGFLAFFCGIYVVLFSHYKLINQIELILFIIISQEVNFYKNTPKTRQKNIKT